MRNILVRKVELTHFHTGVVGITRVQNPESECEKADAIIVADNEKDCMTEKGVVEKKAFMNVAVGVSKKYLCDG